MLGGLEQPAAVPKRRLKQSLEKAEGIAPPQSAGASRRPVCGSDCTARLARRLQASSHGRRPLLPSKISSTQIVVMAAKLS